MSRITTLVPRAGDDAYTPTLAYGLVTSIKDGRATLDGDQTWPLETLRRAAIRTDKAHLSHPLSPTDMSLVIGDSREALKHIPPGFDVVYLDPPYCTGSSSLAYFDSRDTEEFVDLFEPIARLAISKVTNPAGVVLVSVDDTRLIDTRIIMDKILPPGAYRATIVCEGSSHPGSRLVSIGHEYLLVYVTSPDSPEAKTMRWREDKPGHREVSAAASRTWHTYAPDHIKAGEAMRKYYVKEKSKADIYAFREYKWFTPEGRLFRRGPLSRPGSRRTPYEYQIPNPVTGQVHNPPRGGWRMPETTYLTWLEQGLIHFGDDNTLAPARKLYCDEYSQSVPSSVDKTRRLSAMKKVSKIVGDEFTYPKDPHFLAKWFNIVTCGNKEAKVLDPFAGSCTTIEALGMLNDVDGGKRRATCVTVDEVHPQRAHALRNGSINDWAHSVSIPALVSIPRATHATETRGITLNVSSLVWHSA